MVVRKSHVAISVSLTLLLAAVVIFFFVLGNGVRVASFNVNQFPQRSADPGQLFDTVRELDTPIVALQEIGDLAVMRAAAADHLGPDWRIRISARCNTRCVGFLYDSSRVEILSSHTHGELRTFPGARPAFEVRASIDEEEVTLVNVHLKAGKKDVPMRLRQLRELSEIVETLTEQNDSVVVLGDFNSVMGDDRASLERFGRDSGLSWATSVLECSHYYRSTSRCVTTTLDHAFTTHRPAKVEEAGACKDLGCDVGDSCPVWTSDVSDHCPFVVQLR